MPADKTNYSSANTGLQRSIMTTPGQTSAPMSRKSRRSLNRSTRGGKAR